jgi:hypothetical protein
MHRAYHARSDRALSRECAGPEKGRGVPVVRARG